MKKQFIFMIFLFFAVFGAITFSTLIHELSHKFDYRNIGKTDEKICLNFPLNLSNLSPLSPFSPDNYFVYHTFRYPLTQENVKDVEEIHGYTEQRAYFITFIIIAIFLYSLIHTMRELSETW